MNPGTEPVTIEGVLRAVVEATKDKLAEAVDQLMTLQRESGRAMSPQSFG